MPTKKAEWKAVKVGNVRVRYGARGDGYWRVQWQDRQGKWKQTSRKSEKAAKEKAYEQAKELATFQPNLKNLSDKERRLVHAFIELSPREEDIELIKASRATEKGAPLHEIIDKFEERMILTKGELNRNLKAVVANCRSFGESVGLSRLASSVKAAEVLEWMHSAGVGWKRAKQRRADLLRLFKFAVAEKLSPSNPVEGVEVPAEEPVEIQIWTPEEGRKLVEICPEPQLAWLLLCGWSGVRSEEVAPRPDTEKPPLKWGSVKLGEGMIDLPAVNAKTGKRGRRRRRIVPLCEGLVKALAPLRKSEGELVCKGCPSKDGLTKVLGEELGTGWKYNGLRHSYGTYRLALTKEIDKLAHEMGNSPAMIREHYDRVSTEREAQAWFSSLK